MYKSTLVGITEWFYRLNVNAMETRLYVHIYYKYCLYIINNHFVLRTIFIKYYVHKFLIHLYLYMKYLTYIYINEFFIILNIVC